MLNFVLTSAVSLNNSTGGPKNPYVKVRQHLKHGLFFCVRALEKYGVFSVISGREWANRIPCKGEYARRSRTVLSSRPFLRSAKGQLRKYVRCPCFNSSFSPAVSNGFSIRALKIQFSEVFRYLQQTSVLTAQCQFVTFAVGGGVCEYLLDFR